MMSRIAVLWYKVIAGKAGVEALTTTSTGRLQESWLPVNGYCDQITAVTGNSKKIIVPTEFTVSQAGGNINATLNQPLSMKAMKDLLEKCLWRIDIHLDRVCRN
jgi:hypothetical protein